MDRWGNYHDQLVGNDVVVEYTYHYGRAPRESISVTVITEDFHVYELDIIGETLESFCHEHGLLTEELKQQIINEVKRNASKMRFEVNEERLRGASEELRRFVEELKQAYYCSVYPYHHFCRE